jgi:hypothetical protein
MALEMVSVSWLPEPFFLGCLPTGPDTIGLGTVPLAFTDAGINLKGLVTMSTGPGRDLVMVCFHHI